MKQIFHSLLIILFFVVPAACNKDESTGPGKVRWDRETCARCAMAVSDPHFAAQIRGAKPDQATALYKFDDIGCAIVWLDQQTWKDDLRTEVWVADHTNGEWIDARTANYVKVRHTPMGYGLGAQTAPANDSLSFSQAREHVYDVERRYGIHDDPHNDLHNEPAGHDPHEGGNTKEPGKSE